MMLLLHVTFLLVAAATTNAAPGSLAECPMGCCTTEQKEVLEINKWWAMLITEHKTEKKINIEEMMLSYGVKPEDFTEYYCRMAGWLSDEDVDITQIPSEIVNLLGEETAKDPAASILKDLVWVTAHPSDVELFKVICVENTIPDFDVGLSVYRNFFRSQNDLEMIASTCRSQVAETREQWEAWTHLSSSELYSCYNQLKSVLGGQDGYDGIEKRVEVNLYLGEVLNSEKAKDPSYIAEAFLVLRDQIGPAYASYILWGGSSDIVVNDEEALAQGYVAYKAGAKTVAEVAHEAGQAAAEVQAIYEQMEACTYLGLIDAEFVEKIMKPWKNLEFFYHLPFFNDPIPAGDSLDDPMAAANSVR